MGTTIKIDAELGLTDEELAQGEAGYVEREGGLLVLDEDDAVLDLHLFGFDEDPDARRISGFVRLVGAGEYIRAKLNAPEPEEILTETRDGFDKNHPFYRSLRDKIQPRLQPIVTKLRELGPQPKIRLSDRTQERHRQALDLLNRVANEMLGKTARVPVIPGAQRTPPPEGIAFANSHISAQAGVSTPVALLVNTAIVRYPDTIDIQSDYPGISATPTTVSLLDAPTQGALAIKIVRLYSDMPDARGNIVASWRDRRCVVDITITARDIITPVNGVEFERDEYAARLGAKRNLRLFVDLDKVPVGSVITVVADGTAVRVQRKEHELTRDCVVTDRVAAIDIGVKGVTVSKESVVTASCGEYVAGTRVSVTKKRQQDRGKYGLFKEYRFTPLERKLQTFFSPDGLILINTKDPVNAQYFGDEPYKAVEDNMHCQIRLADLILSECLWIMVSQALEAGKLDRRFPDNPEIDVRTYVDEKKFKIGPAVHKLIVTKQA